MRNLLPLLMDGEVQASWITKSFPIIRLCLVGIMCVACVALIIAVLMQSNEASNGGNAITGFQESYYGSNKVSSREGRLKKITIISVCIIAVCILLYFVSLLINNPIA